MWSIVISSLFVCLSACCSPKPHVQISPNFLYFLPVAVARFFSGSKVTCNVLPVLWMTSCLLWLGTRERFSTITALYKFTYLLYCVILLEALRLCAIIIYYWHWQQYNHRYQTSPALCNPTTPFAADRPHRIACAHKFSEYYLRWLVVLNDPFCCMTLCLLSLLQRTSQRPIQRKLSTLLHCPDNTSKLPLSLRGSAPPSNTRFLGLTRVFIQNGISIGSAVLHSSP